MGNCPRIQILIEFILNDLYVDRDARQVKAVIEKVPYHNITHKNHPMFWRLGIERLRLARNFLVPAIPNRSLTTVHNETFNRNRAISNQLQEMRSSSIVDAVTDLELTAKLSATGLQILRDENVLSRSRLMQFDPKKEGTDIIKLRQFFPAMRVGDLLALSMYINALTKFQTL